MARLYRWLPRDVNIFEAEPVKMGEPAVPAPDGKIPATDRDVMGAGHPALPAQGRGLPAPDIITSRFDILSLFTDIFDNRDIDPRCPAVVTNNLCAIWDCGDFLVDVLLAVVAGSPVTQIDEIFHASYSRVGPDKVLV